MQLFYQSYIAQSNTLWLDRINTNESCGAFLVFLQQNELAMWQGFCHVNSVASKWVSGILSFREVCWHTARSRPDGWWLSMEKASAVVHWAGWQIAGDETSVSPHTCWYSEPSFSGHIRRLDTRFVGGADGGLVLDLFFDISHELCYPEEGTIYSSDILLNCSGRNLIPLSVPSAHLCPPSSVAISWRM